MATKTQYPTAGNERIDWAKVLTDRSLTWKQMYAAEQLCLALIVARLPPIRIRFSAFLEQAERMRDVDEIKLLIAAIFLLWKKRGRIAITIDTKKFHQIGDEIVLTRKAS